MRERLKGFWRVPRPAGEAGPPAPHSGTPRPALASAAHKFEARPSRGLEQFFASFRDQSGLTMLDLGGAYQENINFITSLGHKFYSEDFLRIFSETFAEDRSDQANPGRIDYFLRTSLDYPDDTFDGVLAWDVLEYMDPPLLAATADRLLRVLKPKGYLLAFFHSAERNGPLVPSYSFRIQDLRTIRVSQHGERAASQQLFNNRSLEKLFQKFGSVKLFLTRERLREVVARK